MHMTRGPQFVEMWTRNLCGFRKLGLPRCSLRYLARRVPTKQLSRGSSSRVDDTWSLTPWQKGSFPACKGKPERASLGHQQQPPLAFSLTLRESRKGLRSSARIANSPEWLLRYSILSRERAEDYSICCRWRSPEAWDFLAVTPAFLVRTLGKGHASAESAAPYDNHSLLCRFRKEGNAVLKPEPLRGLLKGNVHKGNLRKEKLKKGGLGAASLTLFSSNTSRRANVSRMQM